MNNLQFLSYSQPEKFAKTLSELICFDCKGNFGEDVICTKEGDCAACGKDSLKWLLEEKSAVEIEIPETGDDVIASVLNVIEGKTELLQDVREASVLSLVSTILTAYYDIPNEKIERIADIVLTTSRFIKGELL